MTFRMRGLAIIFLTALFTSSILQSQTTSTGQGSEDKNVPKGQIAQRQAGKTCHCDSDAGSQAAKSRTHCEENFRQSAQLLF